jgi:hypothetical protein
MIAFAIVSAVRAAEPAVDLAKGFTAPPDSARPHTWWHWMNGNITKEGITADLEAMQRVGIGGAQIFNVLEGIPLGPVDYMSPEWLDMVQHAAKEADRLGIELCFHNCAGWSSSGGPWVKPEFGMQTLVLTEIEAKGGAQFSAVLPQPKTNLDYYKDIVVLAFPKLSGKTRIDGLNPKALLHQEYQYGIQPNSKEIPRDSIVAKEKIVDLTSKMDNAGKLTWDVPDGEWTILRIGHTPTGAVNSPSTDSGRGLEVDKMSRDAIDVHWKNGVEPVLKKLGPLVGKSFNNVLVDSYEVGDCNWTPKFRDEFSKRRGYDPIPYLVAISGRYVDGGEATERFLWDFRRTIGDLYADNYYNYFGELCHKNGLEFSVEPYDGPFECLEAGAKADVVMGEFWFSHDAFLEGVSQSVKLASSVAHTHGIPFVGAESFTTGPDDSGKWMGHPGALKMQGDSVWALGVNRYIFHTYAHQPWLDKAPGMTMGQWGTHFGRFNTWWEQSKPWMSYIARSQFLLQQGRMVADVLYFAGECSPNGSPYPIELKEKGYDFDTIGTDLIMSLTVKDGKIVTSVGGSYSVLVLPDTKWMTPALAKKVRELVQAGGIVAGPKPAKSPNLANASQSDKEVAEIADEVWGSTPGERSFGKGRIFTDMPVDKVLASLKVTSDCRSVGREYQPAFIHRATDDADIYFVSNQQEYPDSFECAFRVVGRMPELWDAETGTMQPAPMWRVENGHTIVKLNFEQASSIFVVFRQKATAPNDPIVSVVRQGEEVVQVPKLEIAKAIYGDFTKPDGGKVDVTEALKQLVKNGRLQTTASNGLAGDPAYNVVKELHVDYVLNGEAKSGVYRENQTVRLPDGAASPQPPRPQLRLVDGKLELSAATSGKYLVKTLSGSQKTAEIVLPEPLEVKGSWQLTFPAGKGAPEKATFDKLISWPDSTEKGIKYFSGTATYHKKIDIPAECLGNGRTLLLDLGQVRELAEVRLNGQNLGIAWKSPYRIDLTKASKAGENDLEVSVTNLWPNRLIGDEQEAEDIEWDSQHNDIILKKWPDWLVKNEPRPVQERKAFATWHHWRKDSPLQPSGLLGPVFLRPQQTVTVK